MRFSYAVKALAKAGYLVRLEEAKQYGDTPAQSYSFSARKGGYAIECIRNGVSDSVATIRLRRTNDHDEMQSDYCAGSFYDTLAKAVKTCERWLAEEANEAFLAQVSK